MTRKPIILDHAYPELDDSSRDAARLRPTSRVGSREWPRATAARTDALRRRGHPLSGGGRIGARRVNLADSAIDAAYLLEWVFEVLDAGSAVGVAPIRLGVPGRAAALNHVALVGMLGQRSLTADDEARRETLSGVTVLVTGAGGTTGRASKLGGLGYRASKVALLGRDRSAINASVVDLAQAEDVGGKQARALPSGETALHLSLMHVAAQTGTYVVLSTIPCAASIGLTGAMLSFLNVQEFDANIDEDLALQAVGELQTPDKMVSVLANVAMYARWCNYARIVAELEKREVSLIQDAAEALRASHNKELVGSVRVSGFGWAKLSSVGITLKATATEGVS